MGGIELMSLIWIHVKGVIQLQDSDIETEMWIQEDFIHSVSKVSLPTPRNLPYSINVIMPTGESIAVWVTEEYATSFRSRLGMETPEVP